MILPDPFWVNDDKLLLDLPLLLCKTMNNISWAYVTVQIKFAPSMSQKGSDTLFTHIGKFSQ